MVRRSTSQMANKNRRKKGKRIGEWGGRRHRIKRSRAPRNELRKVAWYQTARHATAGRRALTPIQRQNRTHTNIWRGVGRGQQERWFTISYG